MKNLILSICVFALTATFATAALADVKVKSKQTVSGQSYETTTYIKGKRQRSEGMGGMVSITQCDLKRSVQLNPAGQTYMVTPFASYTQTTTSSKASATTDENGVVQTGGRITTTITTKDTGERKQMFGYTARRLIITMETASSPDACTKASSKMETDGWYIDAAFALDCDYGMSGYNPYQSKKTGCQDKYDVKTVGTAKRGYPVYEKMTMFDQSGKETMTMINEVVEFSQATLEQALFEIPQGYKEASDATQLYAASSINTGSQGMNAGTAKEPASSGLASTINSSAKAPQPQAAIGPKKPGVTRIGVPMVKTAAVGEGITAGDLAAAVHNTLFQYMKTPNIEVVPIEARLPAAIDAEAHSKECDLVAFVTVSHKKGGGGFGMFKAIAPVLSSVAPVAGGAAGTGGYIAGSVAGSAISAASVSGQMKSKDELTLDVKVNRTGSTPVFEKVLKTKAKSNGEDIISQLVEQASQGIVDALAKQ